MRNYLQIVLVWVVFFGYGCTFGQITWEATSGPSTSSVTCIVENKNGDIYAGTYSKGLFKSTNNGNDWLEVNEGITTLSMQALATNVQGHIFAGSSGGGIYRSVDNGKSWSQINQGLTNVYIAALAINASGDVFAVTGYSRVFRSTDNGDTWTLIFNGGSIGMNCLYVAPNEYLYAGSNEGVYRSTDQGNTWTDVGFDRYVPAMAFDSIGNMYIADALSLWYSNYSGEYWGFLGYISSIYSLAVTNNGTLYAGHLDEGIYVNATKNSDNWTLMNDGLTDIEVHSLILKSDGVLFAGTLSGTVFRTTGQVTSIETDNSNNTPSSFILYQNYPNPFNPVTTITYSVKQEGKIKLRVFDILGNEVGTLVDEYKGAGTQSVEFDATLLSSGIYLYEFIANGQSMRKKMMLLK
jgi:hypothetical protein